MMVLSQAEQGALLEFPAPGNTRVGGIRSQAGPHGGRSEPEVDLEPPRPPEPAPDLTPGHDPALDPEAEPRPE